MGGDGVFWDRVACVYDVFANVINRKANRALCAAVEPWIEPGDEVLECACGTGLLSGVIAQRCGAGADRPVSGAGRGGVVYLRLCAHGAARRHAPCDERTRRGLYRLQAPQRKNRRAGGACAAAGTAWFDERAGVAALCARHGKERRRPCQAAGPGEGALSLCRTCLRARGVSGAGLYAARHGHLSCSFSGTAWKTTSTRASSGWGSCLRAF